MRTDTSGEVWNRGGHKDFRLVDPLGPGVELDTVKMHKKARSCRFAWYARVHPDLCWLVAAGGTLFLEIYWLIGPQTTSLSGINIHCCLYQNYLTNVCRHLNQANILKSPINKNGTKNKNYGHSYLPLSHLHRVPLFCGHGPCLFRCLFAWWLWTGSWLYYHLYVKDFSSAQASFPTSSYPLSISSKMSNRYPELN